MTIAAFDVHYPADGLASAAAVCFGDIHASAPVATHHRLLPIPADYVPGEFYRRELPCILELMTEIHVALRLLIVDGYVMLGGRPGLGQHLYAAVGGGIPVIGVAKSPYPGAEGVEVYRGVSHKPLHVTAAGIPLAAAGRTIRQMHGPHRIPTLLRLVDQLARQGAV